MKWSPNNSPELSRPFKSRSNEWLSKTHSCTLDVRVPQLFHPKHFHRLTKLYYCWPSTTRQSILTGISAILPRHRLALPLGQVEPDSGHSHLQPASFSHPAEIKTRTSAQTQPTVSSLQPTNNINPISHFQRTNYGSVLPLAEHAASLSLSLTQSYKKLSFFFFGFT